MAIENPNTIGTVMNSALTECETKFTISDVVAWLEDPSRPGEYHYISAYGTGRGDYYFQFRISDPNVALEFKVRFG